MGGASVGVELQHNTTQIQWYFEMHVYDTVNSQYEVHVQTCMHETAVMVGRDNPPIPRQYCFKLASSHQQAGTCT